MNALFSSAFRFGTALTGSIRKPGSVPRCTLRGRGRNSGLSPVAASAQDVIRGTCHTSENIRKYCGKLGKYWEINRENPCGNLISALIRFNDVGSETRVCPPLRPRCSCRRHIGCGGAARIAFRRQKLYNTRRWVLCASGAKGADFDAIQ